MNKEGLTKTDIRKTRAAVTGTVLGLAVTTGAILSNDHFVARADAHLLQTTGISRPSEQELTDANNVINEITSALNDSDNWKNPNNIPTTIAHFNLKKVTAAEQTRHDEDLYSATEQNAENLPILAGLGGGGMTVVSAISLALSAYKNDEKKQKYRAEQNFKKFYSSS